MHAALLVAVSTAQAAELKVLSGNGAKAAVRELCTQFERATGNKINLHFEVNADLKKKIEAGEAFDVAVLNPPVIDALIKDGKIVAGSRADIGRAGLGVAVRKGAPKPDISSVEAFKRTLLAAKAVAYPGKGASGIYFVSLLDRMGIKAEMQGQAQADGGGRHRRGGRARRSRHGRGGGDAHHRRSRRRSGRPDPGGTADQNRLCGGLERRRQGAASGPGADPLSHRARRRGRR